jgi:alanine dehydrogenase
MPESTLWISESEVVASIDLIDALDVMARAFAAEGAGEVSAMEKTMASFAGGGTLHSLGASFPDLVGVKSWAHTPGGADPALLLIDARNGAIVAVIEAFALGQLRTSATAGLATDRLAASDASVLGVVGTGKQALAQVAAVAAVRQLDAVRVFSPTAEHRTAFAQRVGDELQLESESVGSVAEAVAGADIVTLVTRAKSPVLTEALVRPGVHINAVGAIDLARQEFEPGILSGAEIVVTDSREQAMKLSSELRQWYGEGNAGWAGLRSLGEIVHGGIGRSRPESVTLFKGMGSGVEDVALGVEVLERVLKEGGGRRIDRNGRSRPVLRRPADTKGVRD